MSVRTNDPRPAEIYPEPLCAEKACGIPYFSICKTCNIAFCEIHLRTGHTCVKHGAGFCDSSLAPPPTNVAVRRKKARKPK